MWVFETLSGIDKVKAYYNGKGKSVKDSGAFPFCRVVQSTGYPEGKPLLYLCQYLPNDIAEGIIDIKLDEDNKIYQINICDRRLYQFEFISEKDKSEEWANWFQNLSMRIKASPEDFSLMNEMRRRRREVFLQTMNLVNSGKYISEKGNEILIPDAEIMASSTVFYDREIPDTKKQKYQTIELTVEPEDCVLIGKRLRNDGYNPAILNMASGRNPGGGVISGAGAQEENLFRRSNLFKSLYQFADFASQYGIKKSKNQYPLNFHFGGIYTPDAFFFRGEEKKGYPLLDSPYRLSVISVPAVNLRDHRITKNDYYVTMKDKIHTILRIGFEHGHDSLVLSAFGCGAYGNDPEIVALMFLDVFNETEFQGSFKKIVFAIIDDHNSVNNYQAFKTVVENKRM